MVQSSRRATPRRSSGAILRAANSNDRRKLLVALRNKIARDLDSGEVQSRDLASLSKRLIDISAELEAIDKAASTSDPVRVALDTDDEVLDDDEAED